MTPKITGAEYLARTLDAYAFAAATAGQPGPVHLEVAGHSGEDVEDGETGAAVPAPGSATVPRLRTRPDAAAVAAAAQLLRAASRPVIVAGGGVRASGAEPELLAYAEHVVDVFGLAPQALRLPAGTGLDRAEAGTGVHAARAVALPARAARPARAPCLAGIAWRPAR